MAGGIAGLVAQIEQGDFIAQQQRAADLRGRDGWCGHGRLSLDEDELLAQDHEWRARRDSNSGGATPHVSCPPSKSSSKRKCFTLRPRRRTSFKASIPILICLST